jgi:alpha-beta hydrolase superfamily lysophospholipase
MIDYSAIDQPSILQYIFYPRKDYNPCPENAFDISVPVDPYVLISCRFYVGHQDQPWILFFHGNGEVMSDYDGIAPYYHQIKLNLVVADYRGYGASSGIPTLSDLVRDSHVILKEVRRELSRRDLRNDLWVMGRSLGSIPALELVHQHQEMIHGLIIESGCPSFIRVIRHLGIPTYGVDLEKIDHECIEMIMRITVPTLIIHGEKDTLIPPREAKDLYRYLGSDNKQLVIIPSANHNDILPVGVQKYFKSLRQFVEMTDRRNEAKKKQS